MATIEEMTVRILCHPKNIDNIKKIADTQGVKPQVKNGPLGSIELEITASIPTLFHIVYQCGESNIGVTVG